MYFQSLFTRAADKPVRVCLMGAGEFGASYIFQAREMPHMEVPAACTRTVQRAVDAFRAAGIPDSKIRVCDSSEEAKKAYADGFFVVADSFEKLADLPLEVLVESSGAPGSGAMAADLAISKGMHVVMVSKEVDSIVGPLMAHKARQKGLVYTTGDGDQPSLLIGLISWARALGLNIVGAGKASEYDFVYDPTTGRLACSGQKQSFPCPGLEGQWVFGDRPAQDVINARAAMMGSLVMRSMPDLCEMTVVANATGIKPDTPSFHAPVARIPEIPELFRPKSDGGLFDSPGRLDIFNCLRRPDEVSMAGGEFIVVECKDKKLWKILEAKGHPVSRNGGHAALYLPQHLLGVETGTSVLAAAIMGHATGGDNLRPVCDMHGRALRDLKKGHLFDLGGHHHVIDGVDGFINDASPVAPENPLPFYMIGNLELKRDVPAGKVICLNDVVLAEDSPLLRLRREQDRVFGLIR
jgi:predicted homoserine dehydrogenase-like protein